jgi:hypothetical protein
MVRIVAGSAGSTPGKVVSDIILAVTEAQINPGITVR